MDFEEDKQKLKDKRKEILSEMHNTKKTLEQIEDRVEELEKALDNIDAKLEYISYKEKTMPPDINEIEEE